MKQIDRDTFDDANENTLTIELDKQNGLIDILVPVEHFDDTDEARACFDKKALLLFIEYLKHKAEALK